jgi:MoaA/NifB/PqqE/SkfB family radical SAM enzyme
MDDLNDMKLIELIPTPKYIVWDVTYACPLRCVHCYSESGRRRSKQLSANDLYRVTDAMLLVHPEAIVLSGGEPLLVKEIFSVASRISKAGVNVILYTSGSAFQSSMIGEMIEYCSRITVSIDGAKAKTHDRLRGRTGSFEKALKTLEELNACLIERKKTNLRCPQISIDYVVMKSNFDELHEFCSEVVSLFGELSYVSFGAVIPTGLASRISFANSELLNQEQLVVLDEGKLERELQAIVDPSIVIRTTDNKMFQLHPDLIARGVNIPPVQVEPDGWVRAMPIYEGVVGSLLEESLAVLWARAIERWSHPSVIKVLKQATTAPAWAEATREIDQLFGSKSDRNRIARRPVYHL